MDLVDKRLVTDQIVLTIGYDIKNLEQGTKKNVGEITTDWYGRKLPKHAHGTANLKQHTSSSRLMTQAGVLPRLKQMNPNIYEAALDLGATPMQALWKVIIPEIRPGMISGFMLALTLSIDDFAVTVFTIGNQGLETLSTYIYADARKGGLTPELRPLSAIIFVVVLALLVVINYRAGKTKKKD